MLKKTKPSPVKKTKIKIKNNKIKTNKEKTGEKTKTILLHGTTYGLRCGHVNGGRSSCSLSVFEFNKHDVPTSLIDRRAIMFCTPSPSAPKILCTADRACTRSFRHYLVVHIWCAMHGFNATASTLNNTCVKQSTKAVCVFFFFVLLSKKKKKTKKERRAREREREREGSSVYAVPHPTLLWSENGKFV